MAYRTLIFGTDNLYPQLKPFYDAEVQRGNLELSLMASLKMTSLDLRSTTINGLKESPKIILESILQ